MRFYSLVRMDTISAGHRSARKTLMQIVDDRVVRLPIRVAIQPRLMVGRAKSRRYAWWQGTSWSFEAESLDELAAFRRALMAFFDLMDEVGSAKEAERIIRKATRRAPKTQLRHLVRKAAPERPSPAQEKALENQGPGSTCCRRTTI